MCGPRRDDVAAMTSPAGPYCTQHKARRVPSARSVVEPQDQIQDVGLAVEQPDRIHAKHSARVAFPAARHAAQWHAHGVTWWGAPGEEPEVQRLSDVSHAMNPAGVRDAPFAPFCSMVGIANCGTPLKPATAVAELPFKPRQLSLQTPSAVAYSSAQGKSSGHELDELDDWALPLQRPDAAIGAAASAGISRRRAATSRHPWLGWAAAGAAGRQHAERTWR